MGDKETSLTEKRNRQSIGVVAARKREELQKMREVEQQRLQSVRKERDQLTRELAELEVQERRIQRISELKEKQRASFLLGDLVLAVIRAQGMEDFAFGRSNLDQLKYQDMAVVNLVIGRMKSPSNGVKLDVEIQGNDPTVMPDISV